MLWERIESLPGGPQWKCHIISEFHVAGNKPIQLFYRDALECFEFLFSNPLYESHMDFVPRKVWEDNKKKKRIYTEILTGDLVHKIQV